MPTEPEFDIYPELDEEIQEATEGMTPPETPIEVAVDGLQKVVHEAAGRDYRAASRKLRQILKPVPDDRSVNMAYNTDDRPEYFYLRHKDLAEDVEEKKADLQYHTTQYAKRNWFSKHLTMTGRWNKDWIEEDKAGLRKARRPYNQNLREAKKHIDIYHEEANVLQAMADSYNQLIKELSADYEVEEPAIVQPDELLKRIERADIPTRDWESSELESRGSCGLFVVSRRAVAIMALKDFFTPKQPVQIMKDVDPSKTPNELPRSDLVEERDEAEQGAEAMGSHYIMKVRQAFNGRQTKVFDMPGEFYLPVSNLAAALIKYINYDDGYASYRGRRANPAQFLDCWTLFDNYSSYPRDEAYAAYDLIDIKDEKLDNKSHHLTKAA